MYIPKDILPKKCNIGFSKLITLFLIFSWPIVINKLIMDIISASNNLIDGNWLKAIKLNITQHIACVTLLSIRFRKKRFLRLKSIAPVHQS